MCIGYDNNGLVLGWFLEEVVVDVLVYSEYFVFFCYRWLVKNEDDGKIERDLVLGRFFCYYVNIKRLFFGDNFFFDNCICVLKFVL